MAEAPEATAELRVSFSQLFIDGAFGPSSAGKTFPTTTPATGAPLADVAEASEADVDRAVAAARKAFEAGPWPKMPARERGRLLARIAERLMARADEVALLETLDNGKPIFESRQVDIPTCADVLFYYAGWADKISGETLPLTADAFHYTLREPLGVIGAITPWNFPLLLAVWKIAPALSAGNTVVLKPASQTPLSCLAFADVCREAGLPPGVLNVVPGPGATAGARLIAHPDVDKIAFTGSVDVGKRVMAACAGSLKKISLELGGKSPNVIFADADLEAAARGALNGIFYGKGEVCAAGSRLLVEESVHDQIVETIAAKAKKMVPGDPLDPKTRLGSLVSEEQRATVMRYVQAGMKDGARLVAGGKPASVNGAGAFHEATIFEMVQPSMTIAREEIFGPVLSVISFRDEGDAARIANGTIYGLAAAVWTKDLSKAHRMARALKAGTVWINAYNLYDAALPFGGYKQSGFGRELGSAALEGYTQVKSVWLRL
jgi:acyl-CoA reductase-like NAD-dependent aldehyde dehydrogenase